MPCMHSRGFSLQADVQMYVSMLGFKSIFDNFYCNG
jgi:hypothetical protein